MTLAPADLMTTYLRDVVGGGHLDLIAELRGRIWRKAVGKSELAAHRAAHEVIATRLFGGRTMIHVLADEHPGEGFEPAEGGLEDVYFSTLSPKRRAA